MGRRGGSSPRLSRIPLKQARLRRACQCGDVREVRPPGLEPTNDFTTQKCKHLSSCCAPRFLLLTACSQGGAERCAPPISRSVPLEAHTALHCQQRKLSACPKRRACRLREQHSTTRGDCCKQGAAPQPQVLQAWLTRGGPVGGGAASEAGPRCPDSGAVWRPGWNLPLPPQA